MNCNDFDLLIDEMLSGILHPDASQHMRHCERCTSHYRARLSVQRSLHKLAAAVPAGPSRETDRAVMESFRRLQQRRGGGGVATAEVISFPVRSLPPAWTQRSWWSGAAAAAVLVAAFGSTLHFWHPATVQAPTAAPATAAAAPAPQQQSPARTMQAVVHVAARRAQRAVNHATAAANAARTELASVEPARAERPQLRTASIFGGAESMNALPQLPTNAPPVMRLASSGSASDNVAQSASSTFPGYSNLMYCDPVVCSGPMQVIRIRVPVNQVKPNLGQSMGNTFVNADVVVGPDGMARAIRVAN